MAQIICEQLHQMLENSRWLFMKTESVSSGIGKGT
jgi:hypothetical protein